MGSLLALKWYIYTDDRDFVHFAFFLVISVNLLSKFRHAEAVEATAHQPQSSTRDESHPGCSDATLGDKDVSQHSH